MAILSCHVSIKLPPKISDGQEVSRLQSSLIPKSTGIVTARELASPPFEDVYIRACADEVALNQRRI